MADQGDNGEAIRLEGVSVYSARTIALLGYPEQIRVSRAAIEMLLTVRHTAMCTAFLEKKHQELAKEELKIRVSSKLQYYHFF